MDTKSLLNFKSLLILCLVAGIGIYVGEFIDFTSVSLFKRRTIPTMLITFVFIFTFTFILGILLLGKEKADKTDYIFKGEKKPKLMLS